MRKHAPIAACAAVLAAALLFPLCGGDEPPPPLQLFNGKDLSSFTTWLADSGREDPDHVFSVVDSIDGAPAIRVSGQHMGGLITKEEFENYHLTVEFRWGLVTWGGRKQSTRDSGVLIHCQDPPGGSSKDGKGPWMASIEAQVIEGGVGDIILVPGFDKEGSRIEPRVTATGQTRDGGFFYDPKAEPREIKDKRINWWGRDPDWKDALGFRGKNDVESAYPGWTRYEVIADGDRITYRVNGQVVNAATGTSLRKGKILLQSELAEIYFRKVEIRPLGR